MIMVPLNLIPDVVRNLAHEHKQVVSISLFVAILYLCLVIAHLLEENRWVNESIVAIIVVSLKPSLFEFFFFFWFITQVHHSWHQESESCHNDKIANL